MFFKKNNVIIYIVLFIFIFSLLFPVYVNAIDEDSIYVWSNNSTVSTSNTSLSDKENNDNQDYTR